MKRQTAIRFGLMLVAAAVLFALPPVAGAEVFFGVKQYNKPKGAPVTSSDKFFVPYGSYDHYIFVKNGADGNEVKNISIEINGEEVVTSADLRSANPLRKPITLQPMENEITVTLKGQGGNAAFVEVGGTMQRRD